MTEIKRKEYLLPDEVSEIGEIPEQVRRRAVFDWDHTIPEKEGALYGANFSFYNLLKNVFKSTKTPVHKRFLASFLAPFFYFATSIRPDVTLKPSQLKFMELFSGIHKDDLGVTTEQLPEDKRMVDWMKSLDDEGYRVTIMTHAPVASVESYMEDLGIDADVYGLKFRYKDNRVAGIDMEDPYTNLLMTRGSKGKSVMMAAFIGQGYDVPVVVGNSDYDRPDTDIIEAYLRHNGSEKNGEIKFYKVSNIDMTEEVLNFSSERNYTPVVSQ